MVATSNYIKNYYRKNKIELVEYMGGHCQHCKIEPKNIEYIYSVFVVDEIIPLGIGKRKFTCLSIGRLIMAKKLFDEGKTQLLCQNCSAIKTYKNQDTHKCKRQADLLELNRQDNRNRLKNDIFT